MNSCRDSCAGSMASPDLLGCVTSCDSFKSTAGNIKAGQSIYPQKKRDFGCGLTYERRNADQVKAGTFFESLSFSFHYTDGIGDGSFYIIGSGLSDASKIIDFSGVEDKKEVGDLQEGGVTDVVFLRADPALLGVPTFSASGIDNITGELKQLKVTLDKNFNPQDPFAKIKSISFKVQDGQKIKHDIQCF